MKRCVCARGGTGVGGLKTVKVGILVALKTFFFFFSPSYKDFAGYERSLKE